LLILNLSFLISPTSNLENVDENEVAQTRFTVDG